MAAGRVARTNWVRGMTDHERDGEGDDGDEDGDVPGRVQTICHYCGGGGMVADPKLALIGGAPRTVDNGRPCDHCGTDDHFPGILPPV